MPIKSDDLLIESAIVILYNTDIKHSIIIQIYNKKEKFEIVVECAISSKNHWYRIIAEDDEYF